MLWHLSVTAVLIWIEKLWFVYCWSGKLIAWYVDAFLACKEGGYREKWRASGTRNETEERGAGLLLTRINYLPSNKVDIVRSHEAICLGVHFLACRQGDIARGYTRRASLGRRKRGAGFPLTRITYLPTSKGDIARSSARVARLRRHGSEGQACHLLGCSLFSHEYHFFRQTKWTACSQVNVFSEMPSSSYRLS